jgi:hypothetical protein
LPAEKRGDRWFVAVSVSDTGPDHDPNTRPDAGPDATGFAPDALIAQLRDENAYLRQQLDHQTHIIAGLVQRLPELPAGTDAQTMPQDRDPATLRGDLDSMTPPDAPGVAPASLGAVAT